MDGDGDLDAFIACDNNQPDQVWLNNGQGLFSNSGQALGNSNSKAVALGDLDGDGDLDAYVVGTVDQIWSNNGYGIFTNTQVISSSSGSMAIDLGDLDGDGDLDAFVGDIRSPVRLNNGQGNFSDSGQVLGNNTLVTAVVLGDIDGDRDLDAFITKESGGNYVWLNDGFGFFSDSNQRLGTHDSHDIALGDLDNDGDLDAFVANFEQASQVWLNRNHLVVSLAGPTIATSSSPITYTLNITNISYITLTNLIITNAIPLGATYLNGGTKVGDVISWTVPSLGAKASTQVSFAVIASTPITNSNYGVLADKGISASAIGKRAVMTLVDPFTVTTTFPLSNGLAIARDGIISATFSQAVNNNTVTPRTFAVWGKQTGFYSQSYTITDSTVLFDPQPNYKPGEEIVVSLNHGLHAADGAAFFPYTWQFYALPVAGSGLFRQGNIFSTARDVALGDLNSDGNLDIFAVGGGVWVNLNIQEGDTKSRGLEFNSFSEAVALGDLDNDGDLDAFVGNSNGHSNKIWLNDGTGVFADSGQRLGSSSTSAVALGDLDQDGDLDVFVGNIPGPNEVWLNDGKGNFRDSDQRLGILPAYDIALGDVDQDGDIDAFLASGSDKGNQVWFNDGTGYFNDSGQRFGNGIGTSAALGDVDGDGDIDVFIGNSPDSFGYKEQDEIWLNDGLGYFTNSGQRLDDFVPGYLSDSHGVALGDLDGDGDLDAYVANFNRGNGEPDKIWLNNGLGHFSDSGQRLGNAPSTSVVLGDIDNDGDLDAFAGSNINSEVWLNQNYTSSFIVTKTAPLTATPGSPITYTLTVTNSGNLTATNLLITDTIPTGANYVSGGMWSGNVVSWTVASLPPASAVQVSFVVTATQTITNNDYRVSADGGVTAIGQVAVVTFISPPDCSTLPPNAVCVVDENKAPVPGARIYHKGQPVGMTNAQGVFTFTTLAANDTLTALQPVYEQPTDKPAHNPDAAGNFAFRIYRTSMPVSNSGQVGLYSVPGDGLAHTLMVSPTQTLILFNLVVSIEWDASAEYLNQLKQGFSYASNRLYDATDGQMAFGWVTIYDQAEHWADADIQIQAHNQARPWSYVGGINSSDINRISYKGLTPNPGQILLGRYWNGDEGDKGRWDEPYGYMTILHEFGHYALFLFDEYFFYQQNGNYLIWQPSRCSFNGLDPASLMYNQYTKTELCNRPEQYHLPTRQTQVYGTGETSWDTISGIYSDTLHSRSLLLWILVSPRSREVNFVLGPEELPLSFPQIITKAIPDQSFTKPIIVAEQGKPANAIVTLAHTLTNSTVITISQGMTNQTGQIDVLGVNLGDRICAQTIDIGLNDERSGCLTVQNTNQENLYLSGCKAGVDCIDIGPSHKRCWTGGPQDELNLTTVEGNLILYAPAGSFTDQTEVQVGATNTLPQALPQGLTILGQPYLIEATGTNTVSANIQAANSMMHSERGMALTMTYSPNQLDSVEETSLALYHYNDQQWLEVTPSTLNTNTNQISVSTDLFGLYALMSTQTKTYLPLIIK